jgi:chromosome segregation ATPase
MKWRIGKDTNIRISAMETAIARLTAEVSQVKEIARDTQERVGQIQQTLADNHVAHAECSTLQNGRWTAYEKAHERLENDLKELTELVKQNTLNIQILSASVARLAQRGE